MDELLPVALEDAITLFLRALGVMIINSVANWFSVLIAIPTILVFIWLRQYYLKTAREVKRLDGIMRSPMYNHVTNTIQVPYTNILKLRLGSIPRFSLLKGYRILEYFLTRFFKFIFL